MKIMGAIVASIAIVFTFQNCQKAPFADEIASQYRSNPAQKIDLKNEKISQLDVFIDESETITRSGRSFQLMVTKTLQIDLNSGVLQAVSDSGGAPVQYCLNENLKNELLGILKTSQICKTPSTPPAGTMCSMAIIPAYAQLLTDVSQYNLGYANDGCKTNMDDLCGDKSAMLKGFIAALKTNYKTLICLN